MKKSKQAQEIEMVSYLIHYYCKKHHQSPCVSCEELRTYATQRIEMCPFLETKTFCSACKVHCYNDEMRNEIKKVMRYSGPRMLLHRPIMALKHVYIERKEKRL